MLPLLKVLSDGNTHSMKQVTKQIEDVLNLSDEERERMLPSGQQRYISNRVGWAKTYLKHAGLVESPSRGFVKITVPGQAVLSENPPLLNAKYLTKSPGFDSFTNQMKPGETDERQSSDENKQTETPDEAMEAAYSSIRNALASELLNQVMGCSPTFFERLVLDLLIRMGYGGAFPEASTHVGRTGDGGIDGIINEDKLGLDVICIQAKRWRDNVGRPAVQAFAGSMEAHRAKKGVMITTSAFSNEANDFVQRIERKIVLIDGNRLSQLMIDYDVGVSAARTFVIKKVDSDYFSESDQL